MARKVIIDTDAGGDDAMAILMVLAVPEIEVVAITCTYGNTKESNVVTNVLKILTVANRPDIPVFEGAVKPFYNNYTPSTYFGNDGLGDFVFKRNIIGSVDRSKHASIAMVDLVKQNPGEINILALGPLTNIALAAILYPKFTENVNRFYVMGSALNKNVKKPAIEYNFSLDPEADAIFLESNVKNKSLIAPHEVVHKYNDLKKWRLEVLGKIDSEKMRFLNKAEAVILENMREWSPADSIAAAMMIRPNIITELQAYKMSSVLCGSFDGEVSVEAGNGNANVDVATDFNIEIFKDMLMKYLL